MQLIKEGAEARLFLAEQDGNKVLVKERIAKGYREKALDYSIRKQRTRSEEKLLRTAERAGIKVPGIIEVREFSIVMEFIDGDTVKNILTGKKLELCQRIGKNIGKLHAHNLIHGDLTTSNMLLKGNELFFIDFGLGFMSGKVEDKAVDLLNLRKTFEATHSMFFEKGWASIVKAYLKECRGKQAVEHMEKVEKRARYKGAV